MCTIIGGFITGKVGRSDVDRLNYMITLKGGDYTQVVYFMPDKTISFDSTTSLLMDKDPGTAFLIFSRLTPEMEDADVKIKQPYKTVNGNYIAAHGTIPISSEFDGIIDTEIFRFDINIETSITKTNELNGKVALIQYLPDENLFYGIHNGLGLYLYQNSAIKIVSNISAADSKYIEPMRYTFLCDKVDIRSYHHYEDYNDLVVGVKKLLKIDTISFDRQMGVNSQADVIISLCSGGMDTILSTYKVIKENQKTETVELLYYDWGTNASISEMKSNELFLEILREDFDKMITTNIIYAKPAFNNILEMAGLVDVRLQNPDAVGEGKHEAENAISYVPLRNTFLLLFAAAYAEQKYPGKKVQFVIGANLTEGMVYLDNSTNYLSKMGSLMRVAGQKTFKFEICAPYANKTKTKMLQDFAEEFSEIKMFELLKSSMSCYFPKDGLPCGKCGSCLLREKSIQKYEEHERKLNSICGSGGNSIDINRGQSI